VTVRELFRDILEIQKPVSKPLMAKLAEFVDEGYALATQHRERLIELGSTDFLDDYFAYVDKEQRHLLEVLTDFSSIKKLPIEVIVEYLPLAQPREYSITSSSLDDPKVLSILVR